MASRTRSPTHLGIDRPVLNIEKTILAMFLEKVLEIPKNE
jgi:hypothetical protein